MSQRHTLANKYMDTNQAILVLQGRVAILTASISAQQQELDVDNLAISQLQGTLKTQLDNLTDEQIAVLPQVQDLQAKVDAQDKIEELTATPDTAEINSIPQ